jgi:hypothetical protein
VFREHVMNQGLAADVEALGFIERGAALNEIRRSLFRVPLEHAFSIYRLQASRPGGAGCGGPAEIP